MRYKKSPPVSPGMSSVKVRRLCAPSPSEFRIGQLPSTAEREHSTPTGASLKRFEPSSSVAMGSPSPRRRAWECLLVSEALDT